MTPYIEWKEGYVSRWINSSQLSLVPIDESIPVSPYIERQQRKQKPNEIERALLRLAINSAAKEFKVEPWMVKNPSKNPFVQKARGKAAYLLLKAQYDNGSQAFTLDKAAILLGFYDVESMLLATTEFEEEAF